MKTGFCSGKTIRYGDPYREEASAEKEPDAGGKNDFISKMVTAVRKMDANQMNEQINKMSQSISSLQSLLSQFSGGSQNSRNKAAASIRFFRKD